MCVVTSYTYTFSPFGQVEHYFSVTVTLKLLLTGYLAVLAKLFSRTRRIKSSQYDSADGSCNFFCFSPVTSAVLSLHPRPADCVWDEVKQDVQDGTGCRGSVGRHICHVMTAQHAGKVVSQILHLFQWEVSGKDK